jgi:outer membrane protein OmpA-like peptidoglycan-associated protein
MRASVVVSEVILVAAAASAVAAAAPAAIAAERLDALDVPNGAVLVEDGGSFASGLSDWAAWQLTDGSEDHGWCTPEGKPVGESFVWELDTAWRLDTLALSTRNVQEGEYPGISVKTVELLVSGGTGAWKSLGQFTIGKNERREFPLPKGTQASRVKLVVIANHGNAQYTEIAEVDVFGSRAKPTPTATIAGDFVTTYGPLRFVQDGEDLYGCYDWVPGALVWGTITGRVAQVTWYEPKEDHVDQGAATFAVTGNGARIWGLWYNASGNLGGEWAGPRAASGKGPECKPARKSRIADSLRSDGRVVLYGIRFATGSDVPLPESTHTLEQLLAALQAEREVRVEIAGHTDATASDAFNLDLSNRRASSVVAWLVKKGVDAKRLTAKGYGRTKPTADNATEQGRALNRRVEVTVTK